MMNVLHSAQSCHQSLGHVLPVMVDRHVFVDRWHLYALDLVLIFENFGYLRVLLC